MKNIINIAVVGLGQVGIYLLNELNTKKKDIELKTGKKINVVAISAKNIKKVRRYNNYDLWRVWDLYRWLYKKSKYPDINQWIIQ